MPTAPTDQRLGFGDGVATSFQLRKRYLSGGAEYYRPILKPVQGTVTVAIAEDQKVEGTEFTVNTETGVVTFMVPPDIGALVTAGFEFDVPVRFDTDRIAVSMASYQAGEVPDIPVIEVRL
jgi:uncharacterized protein (TIGR02217 family)